MGDAGVEKEKDILEKYNLSNIDVLKAGHHGRGQAVVKILLKKLNLNMELLVLERIIGMDIRIKKY